MPDNTLKRKLRRPASILGAWFVIGIGIGVSIDNIGVGIAFGLIIGAGLNKRLSCAIETFKKEDQTSDKGE